MTRIVLIDLHDKTMKVERFPDPTTDAEIFGYIVRNNHPYMVRQITICQSGIVFDNTTTLEIALKTAERLSA